MLIQCCSYGELGKVLINAATFLNASPFFLNQNKNKSIKHKTLQTKLGEWQRTVRSERDGHAMGSEAFYNIATHPESTKLIIQIIRMQDIAQQRQDHERHHADPARDDPLLAQAVRMPQAAAQLQNAQNFAPVPVADQIQNAQIFAHVPHAAAQLQNAQHFAPEPVADQSQNAPVQYPDTVEGRFRAAQAHYASVRAASAE